MACISWGNQKHLCKNCNNDAVWYCVFHDANLCDQHNTTMHAAVERMPHKIVPISQKDKMFRTDIIRCDLHNMPLCLYCQECKGLCCSTCLVADSHRSHNDKVEWLTNVAVHIRDDLNKLGEEIGKVKIDLESQSHRLKTMLKNVDETEAKNKDKIKRIFNEIRADLQKRQEEMEKELKTKCDDSRKLIRGKQQKLKEFDLNDMKKILNEIKDIDCDSIEGMRRSKEIMEKMTRIQNEHDTYSKSKMADPWILFYHDSATMTKCIKEFVTFDPKITPNVSMTTSWAECGTTVSGGPAQQSGMLQLNRPSTVIVDHNQTMIIKDQQNNRIVQWKKGDKTGQVIIPEINRQSQSKPISRPTSIAIDKTDNSIIVCDRPAKKITKWLRNATNNQFTEEVVLKDINCYGIALDDEHQLYVFDGDKYAVMRYELNKSNLKPVPVAGNNGKGGGLNQLDLCEYIFVDKHKNVYVSDTYNHRVMKWPPGATEGIIVAGGRGEGSGLHQLSYPRGIMVDSADQLYVADSMNDRVLSIPIPNATVIAGGQGRGDNDDQLNIPVSLFLDQDENLYVCDQYNNRIQMFSPKPVS